MIYSPVSLSPSGIAIDPTIDNTFSWTNRGSPQDSFQIRILRNDNNVQIYDSTKLSSTNTYFTIPANTMTAGINYQWNVQVWYGTSTATSSYAFIAANDAPTLTFTAPDFALPPIVLSGQDYIFQVSYAQAQDVSVSKYGFILYDSLNNIIEDTGYIYGFTLQYAFNGMIRGDTYGIKCYAVAQNNMYVETVINQFEIDTYTIPDTVPDITTIPDNCSASITVDWADLKLVEPVVNGAYSFVPGKFDQGVLLDQGTTFQYTEVVSADNNILSGWYKFRYGQDGDFVQLGSSVFGGFDHTLQMFYIRNGSNYFYSQPFGLYVWDEMVGNWEDYTLTWQNPGFDPTAITANWFFIAINNTMSMTTFFNDVFAFTVTTNTPVTTNFASIVFTGKILLDNMRANNQSMTQTEIESISLITPQLWIVPTNWLANYDGNLQAGNISNNVPIIGWRLKRKKVGDAIFEVVSDFPKETRNYTDYTPMNDINYVYSIFSLSSEGEGLGLESSATVSFWGWYLINPSTGRWFKFDAGFNGIQTDKIQIVQNAKTLNKQDQFPTVMYGLQKYRQSRITAVPYYLDANNNIVVNSAVLDDAEALILDKSEKILKNYAGYVMLVSTYGTDYKYKDQVGSQPFEVTFDWVETNSNNFTT